MVLGCLIAWALGCLGAWVLAMCLQRRVAAGSFCNRVLESWGDSAMDCALEESDANALRDLGAFVSTEHILMPCFYSCKISTSSPVINSCIPPYFSVLLVRRRSLAMESECHNLDKSPIFHIRAAHLLEAVRVLVACPTLTDAEFSLSHLGLSWPANWETPMFKDLMFKFFSLLKSSPSLSCFHFRNYLTDASLYCKHLQTLVCENPRLETLRVCTDGPNLVVLAKAIAVCLSQNTVLKSFTLEIPTYEYELNRESLEILLWPFTRSAPSEANADLKELALYLQYPDGSCVDAIANFVRLNRTIKKLDLGFSKFRSCLKDGKMPWRKFCRALEFNQTLEELSCPCESQALRELLVPFVPDRYGRQLNTTLSTLRLFVSNEVNGRWVEALVNNLVVCLRDLASALELNTTLKHVHFIYECDGHGTYMDEVKSVADANTCRVEFRIREILRTMIDNELRVNTSLESFVVGHWTLLRVGAEWQTSYRGPCLREQTEEYAVKVKMTS
ncbi:hypothetical protein M758_6G160400 [Ceratodon purpureus]|nr:hypothetical protein M758_6G160400 [Ceratodon purpureus]